MSELVEVLSAANDIDLSFLVAKCGVSIAEAQQALDAVYFSAVEQGMDNAVHYFIPEADIEVRCTISAEFDKSSRSAWRYSVTKVKKSKQTRSGLFAWLCGPKKSSMKTTSHFSATHSNVQSMEVKGDIISSVRAKIRPVPAPEEEKPDQADVDAPE